MAAGFIFGVNGVVFIGGKQFSYLNNWTMNVGTGVVDTPDMGSSGPVRTYSKYKDFSGTLSGLYRFDPVANSSVAQESLTHQFVSGGAPVPVYAKFVESSQSMYKGNVVLMNISKSQSAEGLQSWSADWAVSNGPLAHDTNTST